jgi:hypothetical protein
MPISRNCAFPFESSFASRGAVLYILAFFIICARARAAHTHTRTHTQSRAHTPRDPYLMGQFYTCSSSITVRRFNTRILDQLFSCTFVFHEGKGKLSF